MIFDGQWKRELKKLSREISFWRKMTMLRHIAEHRLNRAILYSAIILRKIVEEEKEAKEIDTALRENAMSKEKLEAFFHKQSMSEELVQAFVEANTQPPSFAMFHCKIEIMEFPYKSKDDLTIRGSLSVDDYGAGKKTTLELNKVCNQLVHSYVWTLVHDHTEKGYSGFLVSSDKFRGKFVCFVSFDEWQRAIELAIKYGSF